LRIVIDVETNALKNYTKLWVIVCRDLDTNNVYRFIRPDNNPNPFLEFSKSVTLWIGHNILGFDIGVLQHYKLDKHIEMVNILDTLVVSRLVYQALPGGHSVEAWGNRIGIPKSKFEDFSKLSFELIDRCIDDTLIQKEIYKRLEKYILDPQWKESIETEHQISYSCTFELNKNGFHVNQKNLNRLLSVVNYRLKTISNELSETFKPKTKEVKLITPRLTNKGTLHRGDFRWIKDEIVDLTPFEPNSPFSTFEWIPFNPGSPKQCIDTLNKAGWKPKNKTKGHQDILREQQPDPIRLKNFQDYGWSLDEENLATLPETAPEAARKLVRWLMLDSRRERLEEWKRHADPVTSRIHQSVNHLGTWTHRASHSSPNLGNVPGEHPKYDRKGELYKEASQMGKLMRSLFDTKGLYVGTDADSIQLRILAHYIKDPRFTEALIKGDKKNGTDPHSLNKVALGGVCSDRDVAKTFIYAWLLGAGVAKVADILKCSHKDAKKAIEQFISFYPGLKLLKSEIIPKDARKGFFTGIDGRKVIPKGDNERAREYYMLGGYLQNGEAIVMKKAQTIWQKRFKEEGIEYKFVNWIHDEWVIELPTKDFTIAEKCAMIQVQAIEEVGRLYNLNCPLTGESKIGINWQQTH
jgi:DNA polymerase I